MLKLINALKLLKRRKIVYVFFSLSLLFILLPKFLISLTIFKTLNQPSNLIIILVNLLCYILSGSLYYLGLFHVSKAAASEDSPPQKLSLKAALPSAFSILFLVVLVQGFQRFLYPNLASVNLSNIAEVNFLSYSIILSLAVLILLLLITPILMLCSIICFIDTSYSNVLKALKKSLKLFIRKPFSLIISSIIFAAIFAALHLFNYFIFEYIIALKLSPLTEIFIEAAFISWICGSILSVFVTAYFNYSATIINEATEVEKKSDFKSILLTSCILLVAISLLNFTVKKTMTDELLKSIDIEMEKASTFAAEDQLDIAAYHYRKSYDFADSMRNYLKYLLNQKDSTFSEAEKSKQKAEIEAIFKRALNTNYDNASFLYLNSLRYKEQKANELQIKALESSSKLIPDIPNVYYELMDYYKTTNNAELKKATAVKLLESRDYIAFTSLDKLSLTDLKKLIETLDSKVKESHEKLPLLAYYYYESQLYEEAQAELTTLSKEIPDDLVVNYLTAMVDLEMMQDNKKYDVALKAVDNIIKNNPKESWALDLKLQVATKAGNLEVMEKNLEEIYLKDPNNLDIAEQYAYTLMSKNRSFTMGDTDKKAAAIIEKILKASKDRWFALYCQSILDLKTGSYDKSLSNFISFGNIIRSQSNLFQMYDDFYYLYALKFKSFVTKPEAQKALEGIKTLNPLAYNYIYGTYYWSIKDAAKGKVCLNEAILQAPELSKTHFLLGNVYFENAFLKKVSDDYPFAIAEYKKALSIFEGDPYAWFSLGHVYKKLEKYEEALGAFQKSVYYMPAEDHNFDYFGVSIHARMQVEELKKKLGTK